MGLITFGHIATPVNMEEQLDKQCGSFNSIGIMYVLNVPQWRFSKRRDTRSGRSAPRLRMKKDKSREQIQIK